MKHVAALAAVALLGACNPPASGEYVERVDLQKADAVPTVPSPSPDTTNAIWGVGSGEMRLLYGNSGKPPLLALSCEGIGSETAQLRLVRYAPAPADAKALFALVGNGTAARVKMDSTWTGKGWRWEGTVDAASTDLDVLTGRRSVEATLPGAGSVILNPSFAPRDLIEACRSGIIAVPDPEDESGILVEESLPE